jgi:site-specific DNA recombinase
MRAAIYTRISRDELGTGLGVLRQREDCEALCLSRGWTVAEVFVENDTSALLPQRPVYHRLLRAIEDLQVDVVVAWTPERLHRSVRELEDFIELIERSHVSVETVKAGLWDLSSSHGRLVTRLLGAVARHESERLGERISRAHRQAMQRGLWRGSAPYGMKRSDTPGILVGDPGKALLVQQALSDLSAGIPAARIARAFNVAGIATPHGGRAWDHSSIRRFVSSPALAGFVLCDGKLLPAAFEGILDRDQWVAYTTAHPEYLMRGQRHNKRPAPAPTLLGGLLRCAEHPTLTCMAKSGGRRNGPPDRNYGNAVAGICHVTVSRSGADDFVRQAVLDRLATPGGFPIPQLDPLSSPPPMREGVRLLAAAQDSIAHPSRTPKEVWEGWSLGQRRSVLLVFFSRMLLHHRSIRNGPQMDATRIGLEWRGGQAALDTTAAPPARLETTTPPDVSPLIPGRGAGAASLRPTRGMPPWVDHWRRVQRLHGELRLSYAGRLQGAESNNSQLWADLAYAFFSATCHFGDRLAKDRSFHTGRNALLRLVHDDLALSTCQALCCGGRATLEAQPRAKSRVYRNMATGEDVVCVSRWIVRMHGPGDSTVAEFDALNLADLCLERWRSFFEDAKARTPCGNPARQVVPWSTVTTRLSPENGGP